MRSVRIWSNAGGMDPTGAAQFSFEDTMVQEGNEGGWMVMQWIQWTRIDTALLEYTSKCVTALALQFEPVHLIALSHPLLWLYSIDQVRWRWGTVMEMTDHLNMTIDSESSIWTAITRTVHNIEKFLVFWKRTVSLVPGPLSHWKNWPDRTLLTFPPSDLQMTTTKEVFGCIWHQFEVVLTIASHLVEHRDIPFKR